MSILEILEAHQLNSRHLLCACGDDVSPVDGADWLMDEVYSLHRAHVAQVLEQHERERCYEAWSAGWHDSHYQHTAHNERRGQGHPEVVYSNPYRGRS